MHAYSLSGMVPTLCKGTRKSGTEEEGELTRLVMDYCCIGKEAGKTMEGEESDADGEEDGEEEQSEESDAVRDRLDDDDFEDPSEPIDVNSDDESTAAVPKTKHGKKKSSGSKQKARGVVHSLHEKKLGFPRRRADEACQLQTWERVC